MALNFPANPQLDDTYTSDGATWVFDGVAWNVRPLERNIFTTFSADTGSATPSLINDTLTVQGGTNVVTSISGKILTINAQLDGQSGATDVFKTIVSDDGQAIASGSEDTLTVLGGTHVSTITNAATKQLTINLNSFPLGFLSNVSNAAPTSGQVLKWDGSQWAPGTDIASGGTGLDADTLDGFNGTYYLDYNNFTNTPAVATLTDFSVGNERTAAGDGAIEYNSTTGVFRYTPPTAAGIGALTTEVNDLTAAVVWANVPNVNITQSSVTQHQAALSITESQISNLQSYITDYTVVAADLNTISINALSDVDTTTTPPSNGQILVWNSANNIWIPAAAAAGGGEVNQNAFSNIASPGRDTVEADTPTDTLTLAAGSGIVITTNAATDTITIESNLNPGATQFSQLSDVQAGQLTIDEISENAIVTLRAGAVGFQSYTFNSHYSGENPTIYAISGTTIAIDLNGAPGHPFEIRDAADNTLTSGVFHVSTTGVITQQGQAGFDADRGTLYWRIQENISGTYRYVCTAHAPMVGAIVVKRISLI